MGEFLNLRGDCKIGKMKVGFEKVGDGEALYLLEEQEQASVALKIPTSKPSIGLTFGGLRPLRGDDAESPAQYTLLLLAYILSPLDIVKESRWLVH